MKQGEPARTDQGHDAQNPGRMQNYHKSLIQGCDQKKYGHSPEDQAKNQQNGHAHREQG